MAPLLEIKGLTKRYRKLVAVDGLDLQIHPGEFVGFIGPNGAGKSTTMGSIAGVLNPDEGTLAVGEVDIRADPISARRQISFVPQHLELYDYLTGLEYLQFVAGAKQMEATVRDAQIEELLEMAELDKAKHRLVKEYSGGMARKLAICAALLGPPKLLLLDESFVGLDPESTFTLRQRLVRFCEEGGAILLSSHILDMLERICTRVVMLVDGKLVMDESMASLQEKFKADNGADTLTDLYMLKADKLSALPKDAVKKEEE